MFLLFIVQILIQVICLYLCRKRYLLDKSMGWIFLSGAFGGMLLRRVTSLLTTYYLKIPFWLLVDHLILPLSTSLFLLLGLLCLVRDLKSSDNLVFSIEEKVDSLISTLEKVVEESEETPDE